jgi:beta-carotene ketolase (CrtO type)
MNPCAVDMALTNIPRSVVDDLRLDRYGLRLLPADPWGGYVNPEGASIALWRDRNRTVSEIARLSPRDAEAFERLCQILNDVWWAATPYFQDHPTRPGTRTIGEVLWRALKGRRSLRPAARILLSSPEQILEERFEREEVKAFLANLASWSMLPLQESGSGAILAMMATYFRWGVTRPVGGSGSFTGALASCIRAHGGEVRTDARVRQILVHDGVAHGVALENGQEVHGEHVIGAVDPTTLIRDLVDPAFVPGHVQDELRGLGNLRWNISVIKGDVALSRRPRLACGRQELWTGYLLLGPTIDYVRRAQAASIRGELPDEVVMAPVMPSLVDRTQVPPGSEGETLYVYLPSVPLALADGADWGAVKDKYFEHVLDVLDTYAPGLKDSVIGTYVKSPKELSRQAARGNLVHADMTLSQLGPWRPTPSLSGYRTPVARLWHTAAGAHPMGALNGWSGRTTARLVDRQLRSNERPARTSHMAGFPSPMPVERIQASETGTAR